ncbi:MAG: adenosylcobinamide-GDP ribazoletransferase [Hungatella sp.]|jgi:adenosylcobinamide-GDP ribazoletransferase|uniref:adenosylcobinamide-GDP ribazoletransferase n=1 Tax=Clostridium sp. NkU-1 TaxID=1095009 RepID=UPI0006D21C9B|nr:adenosylcobinamide-GDP ribazoletransferase [Hungatella sp.]
MNLFGSLVIAFSMYSRIPMPQMEWTKERMKYVMCFFPFIGVVIGLLEFAAVLGCNALGFRYFGQILPVVIPILVTGGIHMDGFLDVVDARSSHGDRKKKLEILKDPHTGAFAIIGCGVYLVLYLAAFLEMRPVMIPAYCLTFVVTRALSGLSVVTFPMAKESGLAASFSGAAQKRAVAITMVMYLAAAGWGIWHLGGMLSAAVGLSISLLVYWYYYAMAKREFGGITGDLAGYFLQICELALVAGLAVVSHLVSL